MNKIFAVIGLCSILGACSMGGTPVPQMRDLELCNYYKERMHSSRNMNRGPFTGAERRMLSRTFFDQAQQAKYEMEFRGNWQHCKTEGI